MDDAERRVAVLHVLTDDTQRDEVVDLLELDSLPLELLIDAPQALDAPVNLNNGHLRFLQLHRDGRLELSDESFSRAALRVYSTAQRFIALRFEIAERQLLKLVLDLAHPETVGDRRVDVAGLLCDLDTALVRQMVERPHVMETIRELDEDNADVVDHGEKHLADVFRLPLLGRRKVYGADFRDTFDDVSDLVTEELPDALDRGERVLDDVMQKTRSDGNRVELHVGEEIGHREGVDQIGVLKG